MREPLYVTFDTNTYSPVAKPQLVKILQKNWPLTPDRLRSKKVRLAWWYLQLCIRKGRIVAAIPEALLAAEAHSNTDRVSLLLAVGTPKPRPAIPAIRRDLVRRALAVGFRVLHNPRIAYGAVFELRAGDWAHDLRFPVEIRQERASKFTRHFRDYALEDLKSFGEMLSAAHGLAARNGDSAHAAAMNKVSLDRFLWRKGLEAEMANPVHFPTVERFHTELRKLLADWADFDAAAAHYGYGYDLIVTEDKGSSVSNSIFGPQHQSPAFPVTMISTLSLADLCWKRFGIPIFTWRSVNP
jgi:hypothetical protein